MSEQRDFLFAELADSKAIEALRVGQFYDRNGKEVVVEDADLDAFVANFDGGAAGQEVPIDVNHERGEAGGWVKRLWRQGNKLLAEVEWNDLGRKLVGDRVYRYISATLDLGGRIVKSLSLVNFPAVKGLRPVELSEGVLTLEPAPGLLDRLLSAVRTVFDQGDVELIIRKEDDDIVLYSSDGSKVLGRFAFGEGKQYKTEEAAREAARRRERQIQYFKHVAGGEMEGDWAELQSNIRSIIGAWGKWAGSPAACERALSSQPGIGDAAALCAWLHKQADGKWPAEGAEYSPLLAELTALGKLLPALNPIQEEDDVTGKELTEQAWKEREVELAAEKDKAIAEMTENLRKNIETELTERYERRQALAQFAEEVCTKGLSAKPEDIVELLEGLTPEQADSVQGLLKSKVVDFAERGQGGDGQDAKPKLPEHARKDVLAGEVTVSELFEVKAVQGKAQDYNLAEFTPEQIG